MPTYKEVFDQVKTELETDSAAFTVTLKLPSKLAGWIKDLIAGELEKYMDYANKYFPLDWHANNGKSFLLVGEESEEYLPDKDLNRTAKLFTDGEDIGIHNLRIALMLEQLESDLYTELQKDES